MRKTRLSCFFGCLPVAFFKFYFMLLVFGDLHIHMPFVVSLLLSPSSFQAQLIHDRNTASHAAVNDKADTVLDQVHMTWTKDKLLTERNRTREANASVAVRDLFNMKP